MVNWKAANYAAGFFSVVVFIITTIIYIMFLMSQRETIATIGNTWDKINIKAQSGIQKMDDKITTTPLNARKESEPTTEPTTEPIPESPSNNQPNPVQSVNEPEQQTEQEMMGGKMSGKILGATILELIALGFSAIIWGLTFGQATTGYSS